MYPHIYIYIYIHRQQREAPLALPAARGGVRDLLDFVGAARQTIYIYIYTYIYIHTYMHIYIYIERERERYNYISAAISGVQR